MTSLLSGIDCFVDCRQTPADRARHHLVVCVFVFASVLSLVAAYKFRRHSLVGRTDPKVSVFVHEDRMLCAFAACQVDRLGFLSHFLLGRKQSRGVSRLQQPIS